MARENSLLRLLDQLNCGIAMVDRKNAVLAMNATAERILVKHARPERARRASDWSDKVLHRLFGQASLNPAVATRPSRTEMRPLIGYRVALEASDRDTDAFMVLVDLDESPRPSLTVLRRAFGLTRAEAHLAAQLAMGKSLKEIARAQRVTLGTVRAQLKSAFAKTRTHRQGELIALVNRLSLLP
jgi:DNA-binding CsgD family transcriptional regulator